MLIKVEWTNQDLTKSNLQGQGSLNISKSTKEIRNVRIKDEIELKQNIK